MYGVKMFLSEQIDATEINFLQEPILVFSVTATHKGPTIWLLKGGGGGGVWVIWFG